MKRNIKIEEICVNYIMKNAILFNYDTFSGYIENVYSLEKLLSNEKYYEMVVKDGFRFYNKDFYDENRNYYSFDIPITKPFLNFYRINWAFTTDGNRTDAIWLKNTDLNNNVDSFYEISLEVEIEHIRAAFFWNDYEKKQY